MKGALSGIGMIVRRSLRQHLLSTTVTVLAIGLALDVLGYLLFVELLGTSCYGILCLWQ